MRQKNYKICKIWQAHPHKNYIFKINKGRSITSQSLGFFEIENCGHREHLKLDDFYYILTRNGKKALGG